MNLIATFMSPSHESRTVPIEGNTVLVGRDEKAAVRLVHPSVSRRHAVITVEGTSRFMVEDCTSANGTFIDGVPVTGRRSLYPDQNLEIGPFRFRVCLAPVGPRDGAPKRGGAVDEEERIVREAVKSLPSEVGLSSGPENGGEAGLASRVEKALYSHIIRALPGDAEAGLAERLTKRAMTISLGLGPLEAWLGDPEVTEIMINGVSGAFLERGGKLEKVPCPFSDVESILRVVDRILSPIGRRVDEKTPYVDGRLPDGSRINVVVPPASIDGPTVTIRKFGSGPLDVEDLVRSGTLSREAAGLLRAAVTSRRNIIVSGGTGTGKTTLLNALASFIPDGERVVTIEDAAELRLLKDHVVRLETRPANMEGRGEITTRDLVRNALRMRPDRIIVGECRGGEALDMLQAMNTGHEGSMTTCHANSPRDALKRVEMMALMAGLEIPQRVVREQVASAVHLIVQVARVPGGARAVSDIVEVDGFEGDCILTQTLFRREGGTGVLSPTGLRASFADNTRPGPAPAKGS